MTEIESARVMPLAHFIAGLFLPLIVVTTTPARAEDQPQPQRPLVNDRCPVMEDEFASPTQEVMFHGVAVRFCCGKCKRRFQDDPAPYVAHLPQLSPAQVQAILAPHHDPGSSHARDTLDRWTRPLLLAAACLIAGWLVVRARRKRF